VPFGIGAAIGVGSNVFLVNAIGREATLFFGEGWSDMPATASPLASGRFEPLVGGTAAAFED